jgi:hypothetical protein
VFTPCKSYKREEKNADHSPNGEMARGLPSAFLGEISILPSPLVGIARGVAFVRPSPPFAMLTLLSNLANIYSGYAEPVISKGKFYGRGSGRLEKSDFVSP